MAAPSLLTPPNQPSPALAKPVQLKRPRKRDSVTAKFSDLTFYRYRLKNQTFGDAVLRIASRADAGRFYRGLVKHLVCQDRLARMILDRPATEVARDQIIEALAERVGMWVATTNTPLKGLPGGDIHPSLWQIYFADNTADLPPPVK